MNDIQNKETQKKDRSAFANLSDSCYSYTVSNPDISARCPHVDSMGVCSSTDCTGLIPAMPDSDAELEAYEEMYQFCLTERPDEL